MERFRNLGVRRQPGVGNVPHHCELFSVLTIHRPLKGINRGGFLRNSSCYSGKKPLLARRTTVGSAFVHDQVSG